DGYTVCRRIREFSPVPIIMVTALTNRQEKADGLDAGADDYVTKPIKPRVLISRIAATLRRFSAKEQSVDKILEVDGLIINMERFVIIKNDVEIILPNKEFKMVYLLASAPDKVFSREEIFQRVWGNDVIVGDRTIDVHIRKIREKIGLEYVKTVKGVGYKFNR
ncbi:MAG: response regulator transcription factor, partial [Bacteroidetes bacterium]|nr:response regulator transcription factor [Bacteroidota bacterium]